MKNENKISFKIKRTSVCRNTDQSVILLEPIDLNRVEDYGYDIRLLRKDFNVQEISDDMHFVYSDEVKDFFEKYSEVKTKEIPTRLLLLNDAAVLA
jgi:hypothetical protein